jgi:DNA-binding NtrC family response regulator
MLTDCDSPTLPPTPRPTAVGFESRGRLLEDARAVSRHSIDTALIGDSAPMRSLRQTIARIASIPSAALIVGESGTGKELVAHELHRRGAHAHGLLVAVNSAALPEQLVESELFGHERGAFTGADRLRRGAFENAGGGTLFLDEVGEMPLPAQAKLLRVLEERMVMRVGGERPIPITARVIAATNRDLEREVQAGRFRQDLFYRLNVHIVRVPPLRERLADVPLLVAHLLATIAASFSVRPKQITPEAVALLAAHDWKKNNVRELRNCIERMMIATDGDLIVAGDVPAEIRADDHQDAGDAPGAPGTLKALKAEAERHIILNALDQYDWHVTRTAEALGLSDHSSLLKVMRRHGISRGAHRDA